MSVPAVSSLDKIRSDRWKVCKLAYTYTDTDIQTIKNEGASRNSNWILHKMCVLSKMKAYGLMHMSKTKPKSIGWNWKMKSITSQLHLFLCEDNSQETLFILWCIFPLKTNKIFFFKDTYCRTVDDIMNIWC